MERAPAILLDEVCWAAADTLEAYREHIKNGRYTEARECLGAVAELTHQAHNIQDHPHSTWDIISGNIQSENEANKSATYVITAEPTDATN